MKRETDSMDELLREFFAEEVRRTPEPKVTGESTVAERRRRARRDDAPDIEPTRRVAATVAKVVLAVAAAAFIALPLGGVRFAEPSSVAFTRFHERLDTGAAITEALVRAQGFLISNFDHGGSGR